MEEISVLGIDLAKSVFQVCALSATGEVVWSKRLRRSTLMRLMETKAPRCIVGMEACGGAHYWGRWLMARGYEVKLMAPQAVKAYLTGSHKNDARDARAIAEAASRSFVLPVCVKSAESQAVQALVRVRERRIRQRVQTANQLRGLLNEFGLICPRGYTKVLGSVAKAKANGTFEDLPVLMQTLVDELCEELVQQAAKVNEITKDLEASVAKEAECQKLMTIPHIGPINAAALSVALSVPSAFRNGRAFASHLHLVPRQHASAEKARQKGIGKQAANQLRRYLVLAGQSMLTYVSRMNEPPQDPLLRWAKQMLERKNRNIAAVAVAAKLARISWALMNSNKSYTPYPQSN